MKKVKEFMRSAELKVACMVPTACVAVMGLASAEETGGTSIDTTAIASAFATGFQSMVTSSISMISTMVPIALTLAGTIFLVKKAMGWFKGMAK